MGEVDTRLALLEREVKESTRDLGDRITRLEDRLEAAMATMNAGLAELTAQTSRQNELLEQANQIRQEELELAKSRAELEKIELTAEVKAEEDRRNFAYRMAEQTWKVLNQPAGIGLAALVSYLVAHYLGQ
jgi:chromosome segregation ATPase